MTVAPDHADAVAMTEAAMRLLRSATTAAQVEAALDGLPSNPALREARRARYAESAERPKKDPTAAARSALLRALRPLVLSADRDLLETALLTYEYGTHGENAGSLRAAALLALAELDGDLATLHAVHFLVDGFADVMSGEPGVTAVELLATRGEIETLYMVALRGGCLAPSGVYGQEVLGLALRSLTALPASLVLDLAEQLFESTDDVALIGLIDLLCSHAEPAAFAGWLQRWASETERFNALRYAAAQAVASHREPLVEALRQAASSTRERDRKTILEEALSLA